MLVRDVWLEVLVYLDDPRDIVCLRMVSKALHDVTLETGVWNRFLRIQCAANYVPSCTFPFDKMDRYQLELTAVRPYRMAHKLLSPNSICISESVMRFCPDLTSPESETEIIMQSRVIPGGRYIVTISSAEIVVIWDLGLGISHKAGLDFYPRALAVIDAPEQLGSMYSVNMRLLPTEDASAYRIVVGVDVDEIHEWKSVSFLPRGLILLLISFP
ncbi:hypothetical protein DL93DRAFT_1949656 [Clavulina sp. PMI_390]|nr:hypothetical protein DL93DRAFT_1949656 [Clavulina sp. PMI_390]